MYYHITRENDNLIKVMDEEGYLVCLIPNKVDEPIKIHGSIDSLLMQYTTLK